MTVAALLATRDRARIGPRDPRRHPRHPRRPPRRRRPHRDPPRDLGRRGAHETPHEVPPLQGPRGHRHPPPQRGVLCRVLPPPLPGAGAAGDPRAPDDRAGGAGARRGLGRQGLARALGPAPRDRHPGRRPLPRSRHRRLLRRVRRIHPRVRHRTRAARSTRSTCAASTATTFPARPRPPTARRVVRADSRSATCSTRSRSTTSYDVVATGHNLDDEAAVLLGNVLHWETGYLGRQFPVLPAAPGFARKVKPLVRLGEREMAAYCVMRGIDYQVEECPMAAGNRHIGLKEMLNQLETRSPGLEGRVPQRVLEPRARARSPTSPTTSATSSLPCVECGAPTTTGDRCAFCSLRAERTGPPPVDRSERTVRRTVSASRGPFRGRRARAAASTANAAATSSASPRAASSTPTPACSTTRASSARTKASPCAPRAAPR